MRTKFLLAGCALAFILTGCAQLPSMGTLTSYVGGTGAVQMRSISGEAVELESALESAIYSDRLTSELSFYVSDQTVDAWLAGEVETGQIVHVELLWVPIPGETPLDATALNASIRSVIVSNGEVGIYEGGGYASLQGRPGERRIALSVMNATLRLQESTPGFHDHLGAASFSGRFNARREPDVTRRLHFAVSQHMTNVFDQMMLVRTTH